MSDRQSAGPRRKVTGSCAAGRNYKLTLECGHTKLHSPGVSLPAHVFCAECVH